MQYEYYSMLIMALTLRDAMQLLYHGFWIFILFVITMHYCIYEFPISLTKYQATANCPQIG